MICLIAKIDRSSNQEGVIATFCKKRFESSCTIDKHCSGIIAPFLVYIGRSLLFSKYLCPYMCPIVDSM